MKLAVGRSAIHGRGCFATVPIAEGEPIARFEGSETRRNGAHVLWLDDERGVRVTNDLRYLNHAAEPNAEVDHATLELRALRAVVPGEEVTIHYGEDWE